jgi:hypothetical protein
MVNLCVVSRFFGVKVGIGIGIDSPDAMVSVGENIDGRFIAHMQKAPVCGTQSYALDPDPES